MQTWILPPAITGIIFVIGLIKEIPLFYLSIGVVFTFTCVTTALLRFAEWKEKTSPKYKIIFKAIAAVTGIKKDEDNKIIQWIVLGIALNNSSNFGIQCKIIKIGAKIGDKFPPKKDYNVDRTIIQPNATMCFHEHPIDFHKPIDNGVIEGYVTFELQYGRSNRMHYSLREKKKVFISFKNSSIVGVYWEDQTMQLDSN